MDASEERKTCAPPGKPRADIMEMHRNMDNVCTSEVEGISAWDAKDGGTNIRLTNVTHAGTHFDDLCQFHDAFHGLVEHSLTPEALATTQAQFHARKRNFKAGPLDPNTKHNLGGVGIIALSKNTLVKIAPVTAQFKKQWTLEEWATSP